MAGSIGTINSLGATTAPPDPAVLQAIGLNHSLESAVADLIDNSIDADAHRVLVRFVIQDGLVRQFMVVDDGRGMTEDQVDAAMVLGVRRERPDGSLGHFGMGLKSASFSQASTLTVLSLSTFGAVGRRMPRESSTDAWAVYELDPAAVRPVFAGQWTDFETTTGTAILWEDLRSFPRSTDAEVTNSFVEKKVADLRSHLGLVFHRLLEKRRIRIEVDVFDADEGAAGFPFEVEPIDPFGYVRSGSTDYPRQLVARVRNHVVEMKCHVWPGRSESHLFKLASLTHTQSQGFYLYRNDRLLSGGGWSGVVHPHARLRLARVAIDIDAHEELLVMSMEKSNVAFSDELVHAIETASSDDGTMFEDYLDSAQNVLKEANRRSSKRTPMLPPGQGIPPGVKRAIHREIPMVEGEDPVRIRWRRFANEDFVEVDRSSRTLWINEEFRPALLKQVDGSLNDAPILKALLYLVYEDIFRGTFFGPKDKDNVQLWRSILNAAAIEEAKMYGE